MSQSAAGAANDRRSRWAARENARRQADYQRRLRAWQSDADELESMVQTAYTYRGGPSASVVLKRGEALFYELPRVSLVEVQRGQGHYVGGYSGFSFRIAKGIRYNVGGTRGTYVPGVEQHKITDEGPASITNQRVIFQGSRNSREWAFAKMLGIQHDDTRPFTLMHVSNRQKVSGLLYDAADTTAFRFYLSLAVAHFQNAATPFYEHVKSERDQHAAQKPTEPPIARPEDAPAGFATVLGAVRTAYFGRPGWSRKVRVTQGIVTVALTAGLIGSAAGGGGHGQTPTALSGAAPQTTTPATTPAYTPPVTAPATHAAVVHHTASPIATHTAFKPKPKPTHAVTVSTCGAPANPWGYNFCSRGSLIYSPAVDVCSYFSCINNFENGSGYMTECTDGMYSMSGGNRGACSYHGGEAQPVYSGSGPH